MSHVYFAELDNDSIVFRVHVIGDDVPTSSGPLGENPKHVDGESYCRSLFKNTNQFKQTAKDRSYRNKFAAKGDFYDADKDAFISPQPYPSWVLDSNYDWEAPVPYPEDGKCYEWDESIINWVEIPCNEM